MKHKISIELTIRFESKWHIGSGEGSLLVNRFIQTDRRNKPYIPGSTFKGIVRQNCEKISRTLKFPEPSNPHGNSHYILNNSFSAKATISPVDRLFGGKYVNGDLFFRDAFLTDNGLNHELKEQTRICRYRKLGTAKAQQLFSTQYAYPMEFKTVINGYHDNLVFLIDGDPPYAYCLLIAGIMSTERIGGDKSIGGGYVNIVFDKIDYNGKDVNIDMVFEYLNAELYSESR